MLIKRIEVQNFQSHKSSKVDLDPGVNTFIGRSDHGKSAMMKSLLLVKDNKPDGSEFVSNWLVDEKGKISGNTQVTVSFDNGDQVKRVKGKDNTYVVVHNGNEAELTAFGRGGVPDEVETLFNLSDLNIQTQENNFFLFNMSNGEVMRRINNYVDLELIDTALSNADKAVRENRKKTSIAESKKEDIEGKLKSYDILPNLDNLWEKAVKTEEEIDSIKEDITIGNSIVKSFLGIQTKLKEFENLSKVSRKLVYALESLDEIKSVGQNVSNIGSLVQKVKLITDSIPPDTKDVEQKIKSVEEIETKYLEIAQSISTIDSYIDRIVDIKSKIVDYPSIESGIALLSKLEETKKKIASIESFIEDASRLAMKKQQIQSELERLEKEFHDTMPEVCPLCGGKYGVH